MGASKSGIKTEIIPYIFYRDVPAALAWLARAFGFTEETRHPTPSGMHAQMTCDGQRIMMGQGSKEWKMLSAHETEAATQGIFVYLADVDAHYERARAAGAEIVHPPRDESYGRTYTARDLDWHPWFSLRLPPNTDRTERNGDRCDNHSNRPSCFALHESTAGTFAT